MRTGILGGTFSPVHYGHLRIAEETREALSLDRIIFIPCHIPPHKEADDVISGADRLSMLRLAVSDNPSFEISELELERGGKSYSIETVKELRRIYGDGEEIFFIIGFDSYREIGIWKSYAELLRTTDFVVVRRPADNKPDEAGNPVELLPVDIGGEFCYDSTEKIARHSSGRAIRFLATTMLDISSTRLRNDIACGRSVRYLVPPQVEGYIKEKLLYRVKR